MPLSVREFTAVIGDGSFAFVPLSAYARLFAQPRRLLVPGASFAMRFYKALDEYETLAQLRDEVMSGTHIGFHAFKWRLAMAMAARAGNADIRVVHVQEAFELMFEDRKPLSAASGWTLGEIAEIDTYIGQESVFRFPTRDQMLKVLPRDFQSAHFLDSGSYELAGRCPILVAEYAG